MAEYGQDDTADTPNGTRPAGAPATIRHYDVDDTRQHEYGEYYTKRNPLSPEKLPRIE
jgi:hypothetical protein